jgi:hypothetical protein
MCHTETLDRDHDNVDSIKALASRASKILLDFGSVRLLDEKLHTMGSGGVLQGICHPIGKYAGGISMIEQQYTCDCCSVGTTTADVVCS